MRIFARALPLPWRNSAQVGITAFVPGRWILWSAFGFAVSLAIFWVIGVWWTNGLARAEASADANRGVSANGSLLKSEMQKFRLIPILVTEHPDVFEVINRPDPKHIQKLNHTLQLIAERTHASDIYVMNLNGDTFAASNWQQPNTFVGHNYRFRSYFIDALRTGSGSYFALGTVSHRPGLYLARRIERAGKAIGVLALKIEFFEVERNWAFLPGYTLAFDQQGMALIASQPALRLHSLTPLSAEERKQNETAARFPGLGIDPLPVERLANGDFEWTIGNRHVRQVVARLPLREEELTLCYFLPLNPFIAEQRSRLVIATIALGLVELILFGLWARVRIRRGIQRRYLIDLERQVQLRTRELEASNASIRAESAAREEALRSFREAREALARANRLTILGAVAAEVAHEINQPVAAIRSYAENGLALQDRGRHGVARDNMAKIISLTERIGKISDQLRSFSIKRQSEIDRYSIWDILQGALLIIGESLRHSSTRLDYDESELAQVHIKAVRVQMEQVLINLLQNSLEALGDRAEGVISISAHCDAGKAIITLADNGPGIEEQALPSIFAPFITTKPTGMGLGLGISRDIISSFGGTIQYRATPGGGATFDITLEAV